MMFDLLTRHYRVWTSAVRRQAMADAYRPIVRGFLLPGAAYYLFVTWGHWRDETGAQLIMLGGLSRATAHLRQQGRHIPDELLKHVSPLSWEHINLTGIYSWDAEQQMPDGFRELRFPGRILRAA